MLVLLVKLNANPGITSRESGRARHLRLVMGTFSVPVCVPYGGAT